MIAVRGPRLDTEDWPPNWGAESPIGPAWITGTLHGSERPIADLTLPTLFPLGRRGHTRSSALRRVPAVAPAKGPTHRIADADPHLPGAIEPLTTHRVALRTWRRGAAWCIPWSVVIASTGVNCPQPTGRRCLGGDHGCRSPVNTRRSLESCHQGQVKYASQVERGRNTRDLEALDCASDLRVGPVNRSRGWLRRQRTAAGSRGSCAWPRRARPA